jgi:hypothetical protein
MAPLYPDVQHIVDDVANALQAAVLIAEHLQRTSATTAEACARHETGGAS